MMIYYIYKNTKNLINQILMKIFIFAMNQDDKNLTF